MKKVFFFIQILFRKAQFSGGNWKIEAGNVNMSSLPSQTRDQAYYSQLEQNGNRYTKDHSWLKNGDDFIQVGISYDHVRVIGGAVGLIVPAKAVDETFVKGELLAEIEGSGGFTKLYAPCAGVVKGINPMIETPYDMQANQVWVYKCHLKRDQLENLMGDQEYADYIK